MGITGVYNALRLGINTWVHRGWNFINWIVWVYRTDQWFRSTDGRNNYHTGNSMFSDTEKYV
ncbi:hypothetical protein CS542_06435 [Pedobacter sp. IW39]|nr:hypothetical protein CS542_06435 [Pedobacter sp. IW39]